MAKPTGIAFAHNSTSWAGLSWAVLLVSLLAVPLVDAFSWLAAGRAEVEGMGWGSARMGGSASCTPLSPFPCVSLQSQHTQGLSSPSTRLSFTG